MKDAPGFDSLRRAGVIYVLVVALLLLLSAFAWIWLPAGAKVPVEWDPNSEPIRYGSKVEALLTGPAITVGLGAILVLILVIEPRQLNLKRSAKAIAAVWLSILALLTVSHIAVVILVLGKPVNLQIVLCVAMGLMFMVMGNYMGKLRSNFFIGFRTPWTLSSERSWNKTQRLGGWLLVLFGMAVIPASIFLQQAPLITFLLVGVAIIAAIGTVYSYIVWRNDPHKQSLGR